MYSLQKYIGKYLCAVNYIVYFHSNLIQNEHRLHNATDEKSALPRISPVYDHIETYKAIRVKRNKNTLIYWNTK